MNSSKTHIRKKLKEVALKVTPQRMTILDVIYSSKEHPTAEKIIEDIRKVHPNVATGTVYKVLDVFVEKGLICKVKTERDVMHFDGITAPHHHLYCNDSDRIEDYIDEDLDRILTDYFDKKLIEGFEIEEIKLQINGHFHKIKKIKI